MRYLLATSMVTLAVAGCAAPTPWKHAHYQDATTAQTKFTIADAECQNYAQRMLRPERVGRMPYESSVSSEFADSFSRGYALSQGIASVVLANQRDRLRDACLREKGWVPPEESPPVAAAKKSAPTEHPPSTQNTAPDTSFSQQALDVLKGVLNTPPATTIKSSKASYGYAPDRGFKSTLLVYRVPEFNGQYLFATLRLDYDEQKNHPSGQRYDSVVFIEFADCSQPLVYSMRAYYYLDEKLIYKSNHPTKDDTPHQTCETLREVADNGEAP